MSNKSFNAKRFTSIGVYTIAAVYFLILVGGIVRSTGSGMGCPDWPKCFGSWVPPTSLQELPSDYLEVYKAKRIQKNERIANTLQGLGFSEVAREIFAHPSQYIETEFNATKTWIEYVNRLVGVAIGIMIFLTVLFSLPYFKKDPIIFWGAFVSFVLVGFQGWLGSLVVSTNLLPEMVTLHMALALVLVAILIYIVVKADKVRFSQMKVEPSGVVSFLIVAALLLTFVQVIIGTQVREQVDMVAFSLNNQGRDSWVEQLGASFYVHRSLSILLVVLNLVLFNKIRQLGHRNMLVVAKGVMMVIGAEILLGIVLAYFALPAIAQPLHLLLGTALFGLQFLLLVTYRYAKSMKKPTPEMVA